MFGMAGHVVNSWRTSLKEFVSEPHTLYQYSARKEKEPSSLTKISTVLEFKSSFQELQILFKEPLNTLPLVMKNLVWAFSGFQTKWQIRFVRRKQRRVGGCGLEVCGCGQDFSNSCGCGAGLNFAGAGW